MLADGKWYVEEPGIRGAETASAAVTLPVASPCRCAAVGDRAGKVPAIRLGDRRIGGFELNDYAEPADEKQVWDIYKGNAAIKR